ncbi:MAG: FKBP-type peptidyl-prolyl cis-trans isomerase [Tannerellaceae bacterium]|jgi:FKBP-type peptidyl-prolyl cis-trans isomerase SlyD|nr:FKBP-type peptidyl-prolyl cis-trans isomerase [Tannerellaceae bacterium]
MRITANKFVSVIYDLHVGEGLERELMERATREAPMSFISGSDMLIPAFEEKLEGLKVGDKFKFTLIPAQAYGEYNEEHFMEIPKSAFEVGGQFRADVVQEGKIVPMYDDKGSRLNGSVMEVRENTVMVDFNHPLAGETLHFNGEVIDVHIPTQTEIDELAAEGSEFGDSCGDGCGGGCDCCN